MPGRKRHDSQGSARNHRKMRSGRHNKQVTPRQGKQDASQGWRTTGDAKADALKAVAHSLTLTQRFQKEVTDDAPT